MRMNSKSGLLRLAMASFLIFALSAATGCGDDDDAGAGGSGAAGSGEGGAGSGGGDLVPIGASDCPNQDPPYDDPYCNNLNCPDIAPTTGELAQKGACCYRMPAEVAAKEMLEPGEGGPLGLVMIFYQPVTQQTTVGAKIIGDLLIGSQQSGYESLLLRINGVIPKDDAPEGPVDVTVDIGSGRQNCDGTYSFYGEDAATDWEGRTDADRWDVRQMTGTWDWSKDPYLTVNEEGRYRGLAWAPRWWMLASGEMALNYELPARNLDISIPNDSVDDEYNCVGVRNADRTWDGPAALTMFVAMKQAEQTVSGMAGQQLCTLFAHGVGNRQVDTDGDGINDPYTCDSDRVDGPDPWTEKPDSVCPDDAADETPCYIGDKTHDEYDPEKDCNDSDRPCCDPAAKGGDELQACNAWFVRAKIMMSSVPIRTVDADGKKWVWRDHDYPEDEVLITTPEDAPPRTCTE